MLFRSNHPGASAAALHSRAADTLLPFRRVPVFHRIKFVSRSSSDDFEVVDGVVVRPEQNDCNGHYNRMPDLGEMCEAAEHMGLSKVHDLRRKGTRS